MLGWDLRGSEESDQGFAPAPGVSLWNTAHCPIKTTKKTKRNEWGVRREYQIINTAPNTVGEVSVGTPS